MPLAPDVATALAQLGRREHWVGGDDLAFVGDAGGYLDGSALRRRYKLALAAAGLRPLRFHDLRHTFGTRMIAKANIRRVQEWMATRTSRPRCATCTTPRERRTPAWWRRPWRMVAARRTTHRATGRERSSSQGPGGSLGAFCRGAGAACHARSQSLQSAGDVLGRFAPQHPGASVCVRVSAYGPVEWQAGSLRRVREARASGLAERLAADLIGLPVLRAGQVASRYGVTHQAAMNALRRLEHLGLITAETTHGRVTFKADDVVQLLEQ